MPNSDLKFPGATSDVHHVAAVKVKATYTLELEMAFHPNTSEEAIRSFVLDRIAIATSLGACVKVPRLDIHPIGVVTPS
jgi:hypothetical protein